jgi:hypothetical protein
MTDLFAFETASFLWPNGRWTTESLFENWTILKMERNHRVHFGHGADVLFLLLIAPGGHEN